MTRLINRLKQLYERYLKGVDLSKAAKTLMGFAVSLYVALTTTLHAAPERAAIATALAVLCALPVYLVIPKPAQALADNIADELLRQQTAAGVLADKLTHLFPAPVPEADAPDPNPTPTALAAP